MNALPIDVNTVPMTQECFMQEARRQSLPPELILAVMRAEGGRNGQVTPNRNGSYDLSYMQVNTVKVPELAKVVRASPQAVAYSITYNGCANVAAGAYLLRKAINEVDGDIWRGVARYHSKTPSKGSRYAWRVYGKLLEIQTAQARSVRPGAGGGR